MSRFSRAHESEEGSALLIALIFVTVMGLVISASLSMADTDFRNTVATRENRNLLYATDAAVEMAINEFRATGLCTSPKTVNGILVELVCPSSSGGGVSAPLNQPKLAVITRALGEGSLPPSLRSRAEVGITTVSGLTTFVRGGIYSNSNIEVSSGSNLYVTLGRVIARLSSRCRGSITPSCEAPPPGYTDGDDPGYTFGSGRIPRLAPSFALLPSCPSIASDPLVFSQGTYNNRPALELLATTCPSRTYVFPPGGSDPGVYYFDFPDDSAWTIGNGIKLVGGTTTASTVPGQMCDDSRQGVQFLFGGASRIFVNQGSVELCGPYTEPTSTIPRIAVFGMDTTDPVPPSTFTRTFNPEAPALGTTPFSPAAGVTTPNDGSVAVAPAPDRSNPAVTVSGFDVSSIPLTATITAASLTFRHSENQSPTVPSPNFNRLNLEARATSGLLSYQARTASCGATPFCERSLTMSASMHDDPSGGVRLPATFNSKAVLRDLRVTYTATSTGSYSESLDGVTLSVTYTQLVPNVARFRAQSGCILVTPYSQPRDAGGVIPPTSPCALITTSGGRSALAIKGTVYAPRSALDLHLVGATYHVVSRGVVVRSIRMNVSPSALETCPTPPPDDDACFPFQLARGTVSSGGSTVIVARVAGRTRLRAWVDFSRSSPDIKAWSVVNEP